MERAQGWVHPITADQASRGRNLKCRLNKVVFEGQGPRGCSYSAGVILGGEEFALWQESMHQEAGFPGQGL